MRSSRQAFRPTPQAARPPIATDKRGPICEWTKERSEDASKAEGWARMNRQKPRSFQNERIAAAAAHASQVAIGTIVAYQFGYNLLMRRNLLEFVHELTQRALSLEDAQGFWRFMAERLIGFFGCERVTIFQRDAKERLISRYAHGLKDPLVIGPGEGISGWVAECCKAYHSNDVYEDPLFDPAIDKATRFRTKNLLAFPLPYQGRAAGIVELINKPGGFKAADLKAVEFLGSELAVLFVKFRFEEQQTELTAISFRMRRWRPWAG